LIKAGAPRDLSFHDDLVSSSNDIINIRGLRKVYGSRYGAPPKVAVKNLWFGVPEGQCFGFLGINGSALYAACLLLLPSDDVNDNDRAGKTTTLRILTGDESPTSGVSYLNDFNILTQQKECHQVIGYCPQVHTRPCNLFESFRLSFTFFVSFVGIV
jgi:ATP-binding cassette subfamily A (ABC1) protein 3